MTGFVCNLGCEGTGQGDTHGGTSFERGVGGVPWLEPYIRPAPMSLCMGDDLSDGPRSHEKAFLKVTKALNYAGRRMK